MNIDLVGRQNAPDAIHKREGVVLGPEVDVEGVKLVVVFVLVVRVVRRQVPLFMTSNLADCEVDHAVLPVRVGDMDLVQDWRL